MEALHSSLEDVRRLHPLLCGLGLDNSLNDLWQLKLFLPVRYIYLFVYYLKGVETCWRWSNSTILQCTVSNNHSAILWRSVLLGWEDTWERLGACTNTYFSAQCREPFKCYQIHAGARGISNFYFCLFYLENMLAWKLFIIWMKKLTGAVQYGNNYTILTLMAFIILVIFQSCDNLRLLFIPNIS